MATTFDISSDDVDALVELDQELETTIGAPGSGHRWTDRSPEGHTERDLLARRLVATCARVVSGRFDR